MGRNCEVLSLDAYHVCMCVCVSEVHFGGSWYYNSQRCHLRIQHERHSQNRSSFDLLAYISPSYCVLRFWFLFNCMFAQYNEPGSPTASHLNSIAVVVWVRRLFRFCELIL